MQVCVSLQCEQTIVSNYCTSYHNYYIFSSILVSNYCTSYHNYYSLLIIVIIIPRLHVAYVRIR